MTNNIANNPIDLYATNTMLNDDSDMRYPLVICFLFRRQCAIARSLLWLEDRYPWQRKSLKARILGEDAAFWKIVLRLVGNTFIMRLSFIGGAQETDRSRRIHQKHIFNRMVTRLTAVIDFLLIRIFWSCYRSFRAIMAEKKGASGSVSTVSARNRSASSAAVRAGNNRWAAKAASKTSSNRRTHILTFD